MSFVSYAQNYEDVMLWRALKHIGQGFYIDVGANDPVIDSVTKAFYDRGWAGINIEPIASHCAVLKAARGRDLTLQCAAGASAAKLEIWSSQARGLSTLNAEVAAQQEGRGYRGSWRAVPVRTLADICAEYVKGDIHFLKIDVEGFEASVLQGMDFDAYRPWVVVIEATLPNSQVENFSGWDASLQGKGYDYVYADGLNRFYLARERAELRDAFKYPPNVFDGFVHSGHYAALARAEEVEARATQAEARAAEAGSRSAQAHAMATQAEARALQAEDQARQAEARIRQAESRAAQMAASAQHIEARAARAEKRALQAEHNAAVAEGYIRDVMASTSWRITAPLRWGGAQLKRLTQSGFSAYIKSLLKQLVRRAYHYVNARPALRAFMVAMARRCGLLPRLKSLRLRMRRAQAAGGFSGPGGLAGIGMTPHSHAVYALLQAARARKGAR